jgi:hypothetical protein
MKTLATLTLITLGAAGALLGGCGEDHELLGTKHGAGTGGMGESGGSSGTTPKGGGAGVGGASGGTSGATSAGTGGKGGAAGANTGGAAGTQSGGTGGVASGGTGANGGAGTGGTGGEGEAGEETGGYGGMGAASGAGGTGGEECPTDCQGVPASLLVDTPCNVDTDAQWFCTGGVTLGYELLDANCESTGEVTPQPGFCCPIDFMKECLGVA